MKRIILFGAPGAGKGTQADEIQDKYGYVKISTGDLIRAEVKAETDTGKKVKDIIASGELVSDEIIIGLLKQRLGQKDIAAAGGYIMDGFPRTPNQAAELSRMTVDEEKTIYLVVDEDVVVERLLYRLTCACGETFNSRTEPPKVEGICDECGGPLKKRTDDNEDTIRNRISVYKEETEPAIGFYRAGGNLTEIPAEGSIENIFKKIEGVIN